MSAVLAVISDGHVFQPIDVVELVTRIFNGLSTIFGAIAAAYAIVAATRVKKAEVGAVERGKAIEEVKANVAKVETNTNSLAQTAVETARKSGIQEGVGQAMAVAEVLAEGHQQGREIERGSHAPGADPHAAEAALVKALPAAIARVVPEVAEAPEKPAGNPPPRKEA